MFWDPQLYNGRCVGIEAIQLRIISQPVKSLTKHNFTVKYNWNGGPWTALYNNVWGIYNNVFLCCTMSTLTRAKRFDMWYGSVVKDRPKHWQARWLWASSSNALIQMFSSQHITEISITESNFTIFCLLPYIVIFMSMSSDNS